MKLSVSAYRAHASAHKKILDTAYQLNYGSTSAASHQSSATTSATGGGGGGGLNGGGSSGGTSATTTGTTSILPTCSTFQVEQTGGGGGDGSRSRLMADDGGGNGSSDDVNTPLQSPRSQNTSREEDDNSSNANESDCKSPSQRNRTINNGGSINTGRIASQSWKNLKAVMAYYHSLRKIKRTKSNQRWMKLRTTVQISSAMQKKPPLKREDSFLKRFSSRQIPETQETVEDTGSECGGNNGDNQSQPRRRRRQRKQPRTVVNPDENFYFYWLLIITICVLYNLWTLIVRQSFPELQKLLETFWFSCDSISDIIFLFDLLVQLRTGYLEQGLMVYDSKKLACHYLRSRAFLFDLTSLLPLDLLQIRFGTQPLLRCPRFLKVYRAVNYYYMVESRTVWPNLWRVVNLIHILLILAHWFGCFYFLLSEAEGFQGDWVYPYRPGDYATLTRKYLGSLYWSTLTLTTIGDLPTPETNAEKTNSVDGLRSLPRRGVKSRLLQFNTNNGYIFTIVSYLIGVFIFATIVGQVGNVITNRNANRLEFERLLDGAKTYMRHHKVPGGMKRRVLRWYDYSWSRGRIQGGGDINTALGLLPDKLKTELALHVNLSVLKKVTIFQECQPEFLRDLVLKMKAYIFTPGDSICRKGEVAREMFIIADGILEVISEHGKVLTTMKAGDFFGEIGILNLDGLNKRTADVRSVGYSELFSLSREDVLAAMKDYPEAQEILQALGRKRLMEVKASARNPPSSHHKDHHHHHHQHHHHGVPDPKTIVDKLKNEAKGLRNVLKKSRTHRKSEESLELQPLHGPSTNSTTKDNNKGTLKRMSRVKSHDLSQEDDKKDEIGAKGTTTSPLGAGLPLLSRLRLLKEKQENEERCSGGGGKTSPLLSPSSIKSPPPIPEETASNNEEPIGAGLPLLQRILMLKAKEEKVEKSKLAQTSSNISNSTIVTSPKKPEPVTTINSNNNSSNGSSIVTTNTATKSLRERWKFHSATPTTTMVTSSTTVAATGGGESTSKRLADVKEPSSESILSIDSKSEPPWSKLKKAAISRDLSETTTQQQSQSTSTQLLSSTSKSAAPSEKIINEKEHTKPKPRLILTRKTKHYRSVDDLSPEYGGLPFVKKLKILNERQKLEELETVMKTRSFSLDIPDANQQNLLEQDASLIRSHSEGSKMHHQQNYNNNNRNQQQQNNDLLTSSNESNNETPERRNLKSILKKLSEETQQLAHEKNNKEKEIEEASTKTVSSTETTPKRVDSTEFRKLMRAPTIEGYAARHSKLSKSVTFNRDTLQSPPHSANGTIQPNLFCFGHNNNNNNNRNETTVQTTNSATSPITTDQNLSVVPNKTYNNQMKLLKTLDDEQQYFADILLAIKQVMSHHLQDMQEKFHQRFEKLEQELQNKDDLINQLKQHISELERNTEESLTESFDTVISRERHSWDEASNEEIEELQELPQRPLTPLHIWATTTTTTTITTTAPSCVSGQTTTVTTMKRTPSTDDDDDDDNVVLDIDSATDTDDDYSSQQSCNDGDYENSSANWEIELLAAQMREKRSASLDYNGGRPPPIRRRFTRGSSADSRND